MSGGWIAMAAMLEHSEVGADGWLRISDFNVCGIAHQLGMSRSTFYRLVRHAIDRGAMRWRTRDGAAWIEISVDYVLPYHDWQCKTENVFRAACMSILLPGAESSSADEGDWRLFAAKSRSEDQAQRMRKFAQ
jgi:hypothetical protein